MPRPCCPPSSCRAAGGPVKGTVGYQGRWGRRLQATEERSVVPQGAQARRGLPQGRRLWRQRSMQQSGHTVDQGFPHQVAQHDQVQAALDNHLDFGQGHGRQHRCVSKGIRTAPKRRADAQDGPGCSTMAGCRSSPGLRAGRTTRGCAAPQTCPAVWADVGRFEGRNISHGQLHTTVPLQQQA